METKEYYQKRNKEISRLRYDELMSLQAIGNKFNISRERVRQIINKKSVFYSSPYLAVNLAAKIKASNPGFLDETSHLTNYELASLLKIREGNLYKIVKNRGKIRHAIKESRIKIALAWEAWASKVLEEIEFITKLMPFHHPYDILVNDIIRIDVKVALKSMGPNSHTAQLKSPNYNFSMRKHYKGDCDFYLFIIAKSEDIFIIPYESIPLNRPYIRMCWPTLRPEIGKYQKYYNRFDLLQEYLTTDKKSSNI